MKEEMPYGEHKGSILLPTSARHIDATMLGTIATKDGQEEFIQGVYNFPTLDNPVWYVTEKDLRHIFDTQGTSDYTKDYYLPIGTSPAFTGYNVKICPDQFFAKHAAILGNTGSGKSCTVASIIRNLFKHDYGGKKLENAHIVIFDTNGEYKNAFLPANADNATELRQINAYYYGGDEKVKIPYWLMNWQDFKRLLKPSVGAQEPVLNRAIGIAKNYTESNQANVIPRNLQSDIEQTLDIDQEELKKRTWDAGRTWGWKEGNDIQLLGQIIKKYGHSELGDAIIELSNKDNFNNVLKQQPVRDKIRKIYDNIHKEEVESQITSEQNIDLPVWFSYQELCSKFIDVAISQEGSNNSKISEYVSTLRLRMNSFLNDKRMAIPLMLKDNENVNKEVLPHFIAFILGDFNRFFAECDTAHFIKKYNEKEKVKIYDCEKTNQITILDVSQLPFEVLETVAALIGRVIIEFVSHFLPEERGKYPIVIVLEEAQNYISENSDSSAREVFERIAREGRKYGVSLVICSQRPSELSKTVLSQCNSFIIHRLQNPDDQKYIKGLVSSASADILNQLPIIPQQHAIITGDCVRTPIQVKIDDVSPTPNSNNPEYVNRWLEGMEIPYEETCKKWLSQNDKDEGSDDGEQNPA